MSESTLIECPYSHRLSLPEGELEFWFDVDFGWQFYFSPVNLIPREEARGVRGFESALASL